MLWLIAISKLSAFLKKSLQSIIGLQWGPDFLCSLVSKIFPLHISCSTVSSSINALVAVTVEDFIFPVWKNLTQRQISWLNMGLSKLTLFFCHTLCFRNSQLLQLASESPVHSTYLWYFDLWIKWTGVTPWLKGDHICNYNGVALLVSLEMYLKNIEIFVLY